MSRVLRTYEVNGLLLNASVEGELLALALDEVLGPFAQQNRGQVGYAVSLRFGLPPSGDDEPPGKMRRFWAGQLYDGTRMVYWTGEGLRQIDLPGLGRLHVDLARREAHIVVKPGGEGRVATWCLLLLLVELFRQVDYHLLHAATVVARANGRREAIVLAGASGRGKTTTALALAGAGMELISDDMSFVKGDGEGATPPLVWGLLLRCKVHHRTLDLLPWLRELPQGRAMEREEVQVDVRGRLGPAEASPAQASVLLFLDARNDQEHLIEPLDKVAALTCLIRENVSAVERSAEGPAGKAFRAFARLVRSCDTYRLSVGPRVDTLYLRVAPLLKG